MKQLITCISVGCYEGVLTKGKQYELLAHEEQKHQVKVRGDNSRTRWFPIDGFDLSGGVVPLLINWRFDDPVIDHFNKRDETNNIVGVSFDLSNGEMRWLYFVTPDYLKHLLEPCSDPTRWGGGFEPGVWGEHIIVVRDLKGETVKWMLKYLDQQGELIPHSRLLPELGTMP